MCDKKTKINTILCGSKFTILVFLLVVVFSILLVSCQKQEEKDVDLMSWTEVEQAAQGAEVFFSAWAGSDQINRYIQWAADELAKQYDIKLNHVPNNSGLEAVQGLQRESISNAASSSMDMIWLNGAAFLLGKENDLLLKDLFDLVPNTKYLDKNNPTFFEDFTIKTEGYEVPWGSAQLVYFLRANEAQSAGIQNFRNIKTYQQFIDIIKANPQRFTYPQPSDFTGRTFLKTLFYVFSTEAEREIYYSPYDENNAEHKALVEQNNLWQVLEEIHPYFWREGKTFPRTYADLERMYKDGEIYFSMAFNPHTAESNVLLGMYPEDTTVFLPEQGSIANSHFLSVPAISVSKAAALVTINFLISPEAQARKKDVEFWGDPSVLDMQALNNEQRALFETSSDSSIDTTHVKAPENVGKDVIREFHASWGKVIEDRWNSLFAQ